VEAKWFYQKALGIDERAVQRDPTNRDTKLELAWFYNNLAAMESEDMKDSEAAKQTNGHALALIEQLADPAPSLSLDLARTHDIRGLIFHGLTAKSGLPLSDVESHEYLQSMEILEKLENVAGTRDLPKFKNQVTELVNIYLYIAKEAIESGSLKDAQGPLGNVSRLLQDLPEEDQLKFAAMYHELQQSLREKTVNSR
jgi:tetratricopeptide (TPR) repeat protein